MGNKGWDAAITGLELADLYAKINPVRKRG
jgi:hypothetical protein